MIDIQGLYSSLLDASFRGVTFAVIDTRQEVGRRVQRQLFPGLDTKSFQDLGALDGPIRVTGLISGDDYVRQGRLLHDAFRTAGPATLVLPWLDDPTQVILTEPASITFTGDEMRIVRFEATLELYLPASPDQPNMLQRLLDAVKSLESQAKAYLAGLLAPVVGALAVFGYIQGFVSQVSGIWSSLTAGGSGLDILGPAITGALGLLNSNPSGTSGAWGASTAALLAGVPDAVSGAAIPTPVAAVGPGGSTVTPPAADPRDAVQLLLAASVKIGVSASDPAPGPALACAMQAVVMANVLQAASDIVYTSQQDAITWRNRIVAGMDLVISAAAKLAASDPGAAGPVWNGLLGARAAFLADLNAQIGSLPPVVILTLPTTMPAWLVAQFVADGDPGSVRATYLDIVARNQVVHPALVPGGPIEVLA